MVIKEKPNRKNNLKNLVDKCVFFQTKGVRWTIKRIAFEFFDLEYRYFHSIYRNKINPGANLREKIVLKLREAYGDPTIRYEDVWCPDEKQSD